MQLSIRREMPCKWLMDVRVSRSRLWLGLQGGTWESSAGGCYLKMGGRRVTQGERVAGGKGETKEGP